MEAEAHFHGHATGKTAESTAQSGETKKGAKRIWNAISKYVTFDDDAIFKDPNWPHLWDKKR